MGGAHFPQDASPLPPGEGEAAREDARHRYWRGTQRLTFALLAVWLLAAFVVPFFARDLGFRFFGWPFSFFLAAQGALVVFLAIVGIYALLQQRRDEDCQ